MTTKTQLQNKIQELEKELQEFKSQLSSYEEVTIENASVTKVVYNACFGGFGLSREAIQRYWEIKGQQIWIEDDKKYSALGFCFFTVWLVPPEERLEMRYGEEFDAMTTDEKIAYTKALNAQTWYADDVDRHDPVLVQVVEELGDKANGDYAELRIAEVSGPYRIDEYDGSESIETPNSYDWITQ